MSVERSQSRGREALTSTGRGGAGNFKRTESVSRERVVRAIDGDERGRELSPAHPDRITHSGRGGAGNVRSPSRDPAAIAKELEYERVVLEARGQDPIVSSGRGGLGNIHHSGSPARSGSVDSRSRSRDPGSRFLSSSRSGLHHENHTGELKKLEEDGGQDLPRDSPTHSAGGNHGGNISTDEHRGRSEAKHSGLGGFIDKITGHTSSS